MGAESGRFAGGSRGNPTVDAGPVQGASNLETPDMGGASSGGQKRPTATESSAGSTMDPVTLDDIKSAGSGARASSAQASTSAPADAARGMAGGGVRVSSFGFGDPEDEIKERAGGGRAPTGPSVDSPEEAARNRSGASEARAPSEPRAPDTEDEARQRTGGGRAPTGPTPPASPKQAAEEQAKPTERGRVAGVEQKVEPEDGE